MDSNADALTPSAVLAGRSQVRFPQRERRLTALPAPNCWRRRYDLRRHIERVAAQRRTLPPGGEVIGDYRFASPDGRQDRLCRPVRR